MEHGLAGALIRRGALEPKRTGPARTKDPEEARRIRNERGMESRRRRIALIREAEENGAPLPVFKPGRPRKYNVDEAADMKAQQNREAFKVYKKRVREGILKLAELYLEQSRSTDERFFLQSSKNESPPCSHCPNCSSDPASDSRVS